jgi:hypothetical protein
LEPDAFMLVKRCACYLQVGAPLLADESPPHTTLTPHGASRLPAVDVEAYNIELKDDEGFVGDRANKGAFRRFIDEWRKPLNAIGEDPFGDISSETLTKKKLDALLTGGDPEAAGIIQGAIESFAQEFSLVIQQFLKLKGWKDTERLVIGGGFRGRRVGELAIGRASVLLKAEKIKIGITPIHNEPDEAGLLGAFSSRPRGFSTPTMRSSPLTSGAQISALAWFISTPNAPPISRGQKWESSNCGGTATKGSAGMMRFRNSSKWSAGWCAPLTRKS